MLSLYKPRKNLRVYQLQIFLCIPVDYFSKKKKKLKLSLNVNSPISVLTKMGNSVKNSKFKGDNSSTRRNWHFKIVSCKTSIHDQYRCTDTLTERQADSSIPLKTFILPWYEKRIKREMLLTIYFSKERNGHWTMWKFTSSSRDLRYKALEVCFASTIRSFCSVLRVFP